ncbi:MAG: molybdopterin-dependent oxidoreductase [Nocardioides sp.]
MGHATDPIATPRRTPSMTMPSARTFEVALSSLLVGPLSVGLGLAAGHLVAAAMTPSASPLLAVGSAVIDRTPTPLKEWAIAHFGTHDKMILIDSVLLVVLFVSVLVGPLVRRAAPPVAECFVIMLAAVPAVCAVRRPAASPFDVVPSVSAAMVAVGSLTALRALGWARPRRRPPAVGPEHGAGTAHLDARPPSRRGVLIGAGVGGGGIVVLTGLGQWLARLRSRAEDIVLPAPASTAGRFPVGIERMVDGVTPLRTTCGDFYRVDTRLDVPVIASADWSLHIDGDVHQELLLDFEQLLAMPLIERDITLTCVSNSVGGPYVGGARWLGVRLTDLLDRAGVGDAADQILSTDVDGMTISTPLGPATDGRDSMIAVGMNGAVLPREHGFPARLIVPGLYGFIGATKWLTRMTLTTYASQDAYWTRRGWATDAPIKISSRIDTPRALAGLRRGGVVVGGVAWAQESGGVRRVEVRVDGGSWQHAQLGPRVAGDYWRQWFWHWAATPGSHTLSCRAVDGAGEIQTAARANPFPSGSSGIHTVQVTVS